MNRPGATRDREVRRFEDAEALCSAAADEFDGCHRRAVAAHGVFRVALSGGSTPRRLHEILTRNPHRERIAWEQIEFFFGDERAVPTDDPESNYRMARDTLLDELAIADNRVHRMAADRGDIDEAARDYQATIAEQFGVPADGAPPRFDLILLGMGSDGHTASLFPDTDALTETRRWVVANPVPQLDCTRMTFTYPLINRAEKVIFLISGEAKAKPLAKVLGAASDDSPSPSKRVVPDPGSLLFLIDRPASGFLPGDP